MPSDALRRAARLYRSRRYSALIRLLESKIFLYRDNARYYYLMGMACLYSNDLNGANSYLARSTQIDSEYIGGQLGLAAIHLWQKDSEEALRIWLNVLDRKPHNRYARRGLNLVRRHGSETIRRFPCDKRNIGRLTFSEGYWQRIVGWTAAGALIGAISVAGPLVLPQIKLLFAPRQEVSRQGSEYIQAAAAVATPIAYDGQFRYILNEAAIEQQLAQIAKLFQQYQDNLARREINRLLHSNAALTIKKEIRLFADYLMQPDFTNFNGNFSYQDIIQEPWLYHHCYVRWKGRITNLIEEETHTTFDFLIGYEDEQRLDGIVPVIVRFENRLSSGMSVEIIGRIESDNQLQHIEGVSLRPLFPGGS